MVRRTKYNEYDDDFKATAVTLWILLYVQRWLRATHKRRHHQDLFFILIRGVGYLACRYRKRLKQGITQSTNRVKKMNDNAFIESFVHQFKTERLKGRVVILQKNSVV